jgi:hypothetical protein
VVTGLLGVPKTFSEVRTVFRITQGQYLSFHCADITAGAKKKSNHGKLLSL